MVTLGTPIKLPGPLSIEPSITIADDSLIAVAGPAGGYGGATTLTQGGFVWVSNDGGASFKLVLDPTNDTTEQVDGSRFGVACSCDTDIMNRNGELSAATMYEAVQPFFNVAISSSTDKGATWQPKATQVDPLPNIDRPWLTPGPNNDLLLTYSTYGNVQVPNPGPGSLYAFQDIGLQRSTDDGRTWSPPILLATADNTHGGGLQSMKPRSIAPSTILVPLMHGDYSTHPKQKENLVAVSHDDGQTFQTVPVVGFHEDYADFGFNIDALPGGRVVAAWTENVNGTQRLHLRESHDKGDTWGPPIIPAISGTVRQPWLALRPDGMLAVAYYGTDQEGAMLNMSKNTAWMPRVALFSANDTTHPLVIATLSNGPTYHGILCNNSTACPNDSYLTPMREFLSTQWSPRGALYTAYVDAREAPTDSRHLGGRVTVTELTIDLKGGQARAGSP